MGNQRLRNEQQERRVMDAVMLASGYARRLVDIEAGRTGRPLKEAIDPVARRLRVPRGTIWGLLFRAPKRVCASLRDTLEDALKAEIRRQIGALELELARLEAGDRRSVGRVVAEAEESLARLKAALGGEG